VVVADGTARGRSHLTNTLVVNGGWLIDVQPDFKSWGVAGGRVGKRRMPLWRSSILICFNKWQVHSHASSCCPLPSGRALAVPSVINRLTVRLENRTKFQTELFLVQ
jgi:hypothetical protein